MYLCYQVTAPGYISKLISARRACHLGSCIEHSSSSPVFTSPPPAALVLASLRRSSFFFLEDPCPVDRCCPCTALLVSTKRTAALPWRGPDHCSRTCSLTHCQCRRIILIATVIYLAAFWLPKSLDYSGRAIQLHSAYPRTCYPSAHPRTCYLSAHPRTCYPSAHPRTCYSSAHPRTCCPSAHLRTSYPSTHPRTCYPSAHPRTCYPTAHPRTCYPSAHSECAIQVHTQELAIQVHGILVHHYVLSCTTRTCAPFLNLVHYSCTATYSRAPISCTTRTCAPISCITPTRAPLLLVHHSFSCTTPYSCTAP